MSLRRYVSTAPETSPVSALTIASTSITPANPSGYPEAPFAIRVSDEGIIVNEVAGGVWKGLERGADDTAVVAHSTDHVIRHVALGEDFRNRWLDAKVSRLWGTYDDEFDDESIDSAWVQSTPTGTVTWTEANGVLSVKADSITSGDLAINVKPFPVVPAYRFSSAIRMGGYGDASTIAGLVFCDGTTPGSNAVAMWVQIAGTGMDLTAAQYTGTLTAMTVSEGSNSMHHIGPWIHMRLSWVAINLFRCEWSTDGVSWYNFDFSDISLTFTPTHAGFLVSTGGSIESKVATYEYFRAEAF